MLFRQIIVENQQVSPIVHRRRTMRRHDLTAQHLAILSLAGRHQGDGMPRFARGGDQRQRLRTGQVPRQDTEFGIRTIQAKRTVTAMNRHVLQLYRPAFGNSGTAQRPVQPPVARQQARRA